MRPKYEVGEVVLLRSKEMPYRNGEYIVILCSVASVGDRIVHKGVTYRHNKNSIAYFLDGVVDEKGDDILWSEPALRKKHTPGEMTFDNLMASISSPKLITHQT